MSKVSSMMPKMVMVASVPYAKPYDANYRIHQQSGIETLHYTQAYLLERKSVEESACLDLCYVHHDILVSSP